MKHFFSLLFLMVLASTSSFGQDKLWPHEINKDTYVIKIYEPENDQRFYLAFVFQQ